MNELGISTAKGFHGKVPFATHADDANFAGCLEGNKIEIATKKLIDGDDAYPSGSSSKIQIDVELEKGCTYLFEIYLESEFDRDDSGQITSLRNNYTAILNVPKDNDKSAYSTLFPYEYYVGNVFRYTTMMIEYSQMHKFIYLQSSDYTNEYSTDLKGMYATIKYKKIISEV